MPGFAAGAGLHQVVLGPQREWVASARFLDDHTALTAGGDGWLLRRWELPEGIERESVRAHAGSISCCGGASTSRSSPRVAPRGRGHLGRPRGLEPIHTIGGSSTGGCSACAVPRHGDLLATGQAAMPDGQVVGHERRGVSGRCSSGTVARCGRWPSPPMATGWSPPPTTRPCVSGRSSTGQQLCVMREHHRAGDGLPAAAVRRDRAVRRVRPTAVLRWDLRDGALLRRLEGSAGWVLSLSVDAGGTVAVGGTSTGDGARLGPGHRHDDRHHVPPPRAGDERRTANPGRAAVGVRRTRRRRC